MSTKDCTSPLKVCPFCGGEAEAWEYEDEQDVFDPISLGWIDTRCIVYHCVGCESCEIVISRLSKDDAEAAWNARADATDEQFAMAVHDGLAWQAVRECRMSPARGGGWYCSECSVWVARGPMANATEYLAPRYCPNCGAKVTEPPERTCHMTHVLLYDEDGVEGIECDECLWVGIHSWGDLPPERCPGCAAKVVG